MFNDPLVVSLWCTVYGYFHCNSRTLTPTCPQTYATGTPYGMADV